LPSIPEQNTGENVQKDDLKSGFTGEIGVVHIFIRLSRGCTNLSGRIFLLDISINMMNKKFMKA